MLARTDPDAPKHKGISFLLVPMDQPGIEVRPIRMMTGRLRVQRGVLHRRPPGQDNVVGGVNAGWAVAMTLLGYERGEAAATFPIMFRAELDRLLQLARTTGGAADPLIRQRLAWCYSKVEIMRYLGMRTLTKYLAGGHPGPGGVDLQAVLERVPPGRSPSWPSTSWAPAAMAPTGRGRRARSRPTTRARPTTAPRGSAPS